jgi:hypothetical protein
MIVHISIQKKDSSRLGVKSSPKFGLDFGDKSSLSEVLRSRPKSSLSHAKPSRGNTRWKLRGNPGGRCRPSMFAIYSVFSCLHPAPLGCFADTHTHALLFCVPSRKRGSGLGK